MARVTIEDSLKRIPNRFILTLVAVTRARQLAQGAEPLVPSKNKAGVTALREIGAGLVDETILKAKSPLL